MLKHSHTSVPSRGHGQMTRRTVLRGLGLSLALPWMESLAPRTLMAKGAAASPPNRMAFMFVPNGVHLPEWTPSTEGFGYALPRILQPLERVQDELSVLTGLTHDKGRSNGDGPGDHARCASVFLTGAQPRKTAGSNIRSGISVDQVAAQSVGFATKFPSLELGIEPGRGAGSCDSGYACAYSSNISWSSESTPVGKETNPRLVFERLFASGDSEKANQSQLRRQAMQKSILDFVADDARRLQDRLGRGDQRKLDEYLNGVREVERRVVRAEGEDIEQKIAADFPVPEGTPSDYGEHIRLMGDLMVLAFQTDMTRIATFMFASAGSNRSYRNIDIPDGHHSLSHHRSDPKKLAKISNINRFHVQQLAYILERMKSIREGEGTLLDHSMVVYGSGISDGNRHNNENLPILLAGRGNGSIDSGRHIRFSQETPLCNLYLSLLDRVGAPVDYIGDSTGRLSGLKL